MCTANGGKKLKMLVFTELIKHCTSNLHQNRHTLIGFYVLTIVLYHLGYPTLLSPQHRCSSTLQNHGFYHIPSLNCPDLILFTLWLLSKKRNCYPAILRWCEKQYFTCLRANPLCWNSALSVMRSTRWNVFRYFLMIARRYFMISINQTCFLLSF